MATNKTTTSTTAKNTNTAERRISADDYMRITTEVGCGLLSFDHRLDREGREVQVVTTVNVDTGGRYLGPLG